MKLPPKRYEGRRVSTTLSLPEDLVAELKAIVKQNKGWSFSQVGEFYIVKGLDTHRQEEEAESRGSRDEDDS